MKNLVSIIVICNFSMSMVISQSNNSQLPTSIRADGLAPDPSAMLDVQSSSQGILAPRMSSAQRTAISSPASGLLVYDTGSSSFWYFDGIIWVDMAPSGTGGSGSSLIDDTDGDTRIRTEASADEDLIRLDVAGNEYIVFRPGRIDLLNNGFSVFIGQDAGANDDFSSNNNTAIGASALTANSSGQWNTSLGSSTLFSNSTGSNNTAVGVLSQASGTTVSGNSSLGVSTLQFNRGSKNTAIGFEAMRANTTGSSNAAIGSEALKSNTIGNNNTASGFQSLFTNTTGRNNTANGAYALFNNTTGNFNVGNGAGTLYSNTTGIYNTASGHESLNDNTSGQNNTAFGAGTLEKNTLGSDNVAIGVSSLGRNTTGFRNSALGNRTMLNNRTGTDNVAIGNHALFSNTNADNNVAIGNNALYTNTTGEENVAIGNAALYAPIHRTRNTAIGSFSLYQNGIGTFSTDNFLGNFNTAVGANALRNNTRGYGNTALGDDAARANTIGANITSIGYRANDNSNSAYTQSTALGAYSFNSAAVQIRIGWSDITSIGGYANWSNVSDKRFKENVKENVIGLDFINKLRPVTYTLSTDKVNQFFKDHYGRDVSEDNINKSNKSSIIQTGFIAQEVEKAAEELGYDYSGVDAPKNEDDFYGLRYAEFTVPLVKAVQELDEKYKASEKKVAELEALVMMLLDSQKIKDILNAKKE